MMQAELRCWRHYCVQCFGCVLMSSVLTFASDNNKVLFGLFFSLEARYKIALVIEIGVKQDVGV